MTSQGDHLLFFAGSPDLKVHTSCSCGWRGHNHEGSGKYERAERDWREHITVPTSDRELMAAALATVTWGERGPEFVGAGYTTHVDGRNTVREHYLKLADAALAFRRTIEI